MMIKMKERHILILFFPPILLLAPLVPLPNPVYG